ncbi:MAG: 4-hydroxybenzoate polyprenyltransferase [Candidatus Latescibacterota bacterium]|jgi:4-hydroxybenzoate polyprenyltransferase
MIPLLKALRPHQWIKNLFVLAALLFSKHVFDPDYIVQASLAFVSFCLISSAVYLFNDIRDRESDRNHPEKRHRPIASGALGVSTAFIFAGLLALIAFWLAFGIQLYFGFILLVYALLNLGYSLGLKHVVILDVMIIASGFLLRAIGGAFAIEVTISSWFILCTMLLALFLGFVKRRQELILLENQAGQHRRSLDDYSAQFLDQVIAIVTSGALVSYALYTMSPEVTEKLGTPHLNLTIPFVIYGLLRYLYLVYNKGQGGDTATTLLRDFPLQLACLLWLITLGTVLYF